MLTFLQIRNFTIIESLDLDFSAGFTCITGETGAGKSIMVGALGLLCGARADTSAIREGCERAELNAGFYLDENSAALAWLREAELDDGSSCLPSSDIAADLIAHWGLDEGAGDAIHDLTTNNNDGN